MDNRDRQVLKKIAHHLESVILYCAGCDDYAAFQSSQMRVEACVFNLMQIGELAKTSLSGQAKKQIASIPWNQIYGLRNRIVHGYAGVDLRIVWEVISDDLPALHSEITKYL